MDSSFIPVEVVPSVTAYGLEQLRRSYKTALSAEAAVAAAPLVGEPDEVFPNMFLVNVSTPESAESATRIDLLYMGCLRGDEGVPILPNEKTDYGTAVQSATSSKNSYGATLNSPATLQYYAPSIALSYISFEGPGTTAAPTPGKRKASTAAPLLGASGASGSASGPIAARATAMISRVER